MLSMKKKMFHGFLPILLCMMLLAGAVIPAVPAVTHAEGGDDLLESTGFDRWSCRYFVGQSTRNHL
jgi:hypothetical protein